MNRKYNIENSRFWLVSCFVAAGNTISLKNLYCSKSKIEVLGTDNTLNVKGELYNSNIKVMGHNNKIKIGEYAHVHNVDITLKGNNCEIWIGEKTTFGSATIVCMRQHQYIKIGDDCMISDSVEIWATDSHPIYSKDGKCLLNPDQSINIGNHVWLGKKSIVLKGVSIENGAIVGMNSLITKNVPQFSLAVGNPFRVVRNDVRWERDYMNS